MAGRRVVRRGNGRSSANSVFGQALGGQAAHPRRSAPHGGELRQAAGDGAAEGRQTVERPMAPRNPAAEMCGWWAGGGKPPIPP